tara:strand:- start:420 stop:761 length:342 start_codon:yes stop_codon:yes gene_type:complete
MSNKPKAMVLYTGKQDVVDEVVERLAGTDIAIVVVSDPSLGKLRDPSFEDHRGNLYVGYTPLFDYITAVAAGDDNPVIENPIGDAMRKLASIPRSRRFFHTTGLFGDYFAPTN